jgi:biopolymer transport protein ExbD
MGASSSREDGGPLSEINVTPFVDVVLVLLVIFMVTAPALLKDVVGLQLPKAATSEKKAMDTLGIAVTKSGQALLNGQLLSLSELEIEVKKAIAAQPQVQGLISADRDARHGDVIQVMDALRNAGLQKFAFQVERAAQSP